MFIDISIDTIKGGSGSGSKINRYSYKSNSCMVVRYVCRANLRHERILSKLPRIGNGMLFNSHQSHSYKIFIFLMPYLLKYIYLLDGEGISEERIQREYPTRAVDWGSPYVPQESVVSVWNQEERSYLLSLGREYRKFGSEHISFYIYSILFYSIHIYESSYSIVIMFFLFLNSALLPRSSPPLPITTTTTTIIIITTITLPVLHP